MIVPLISLKRRANSLFWPAGLWDLSSRRVVPVRAARRSLCRRLLSCDPCLRRMNRQGARRSPGRARSGHRMRTLLPARSYILPGTEPWLFLHGPFIYPFYEFYRAPSDINRTKNGCMICASPAFQAPSDLTASQERWKNCAS